MDGTWLRVAMKLTVPDFNESVVHRRAGRGVHDSEVHEKL